MKPAPAPERGVRDKLRRRIVSQYFVRFHMSLIVAATIASGLGSSRLLLEAGLASVLIRYPLCVLAAYGIFVGLIRLWVFYVSLSYRRPRLPDDDFGMTDWAEDLLENRGSGVDVRFGGGDSGGAGASDAWNSAEAAPVRPSGGSKFPSLGGSIDDDFWIVILVIALVVGIFGAGAYVIYIAPQMLPEVALNALLAPALARAAKKAEAEGWLTSVVRSTWIPAAIVLLLTVALAAGVRYHCPSASKLMDAFTCA